MRTLMKGVGLALVMVLLTGSPAFALKVLKRGDAARYIGDVKKHVLESGRPYTYELLKRTKRDTMYGRYSDGTIFNTGGGLFSYPVRKNGEYVILIDDPNGREEEPVTEDNWRRSIQNTLDDDNDEPWVFLDDNDRELAIVYIGKGIRIRGRMVQDNILELRIDVLGGSSLDPRRRR